MLTTELTPAEKALWLQGEQDELQHQPGPELDAFAEHHPLRAARVLLAIYRRGRWSVKRQRIRQAFNPSK